MFGVFQKLRQAACATVGHTWTKCFVRVGEHVIPIGYQCDHCRKFSVGRPQGWFDRHYE